jgi:ClpP class serine protease
MRTLFWLLLILILLFQWFRSPSLEGKRLEAIEAMQKERGTRVITLIHREETVSLFGIPVSKYITIDDAEAILRAIRLTQDEKPIDLIVHTPGGLVLAAAQIAHAIRKHKGKVTVFVPHYAMSGGTLIALAADEIVMDPNAVLGPVDPQIGQYPAASIIRAVEAKTPEKADDQTLILADISRKAMSQVGSLVTKLLEKCMPKGALNSLQSYLPPDSSPMITPSPWSAPNQWGCVSQLICRNPSMALWNSIRRQALGGHRSTMCRCRSLLETLFLTDMRS